MGLTTPPSSPSPPKSVGAEVRVAIHDHDQVCPPGCVDLGGPILLSVSIKHFFVGESKHRILNSFILSRTTTQGTFCWDILQQHLFLFKATRASMKAHDTLIHHCNAFAFLLQMNCHTWLLCSGAFLNTYFPVLRELLLSFWLRVMHLFGVWYNVIFCSPDVETTSGETAQVRGPKGLFVKSFDFKKPCTAWPWFVKAKLC